MPGFRRNRRTFASLTPVAVVTTLTPPDCVLPPTVIEELVSVSVSVGTADACAEPVDSKPIATSSDAMNTPTIGERRERWGMRFDPFRLRSRELLLGGASIGMSAATAA